MAFIYRGQDYKKLTNEQMISDVLLTNNKITADIRDILHTTGIIGFWNSTKIGYYELFAIFRKACFNEFAGRDKSIKDIDYITGSWMSYENFIIPYISDYPFNKSTTWRLLMDNHYVEGTDGDEEADNRIHEKYTYYSNDVDDWYDFFMLPLEKKLKLLLPKKSKAA